MRGLAWKPALDLREGHYRASTKHGEYLIGPRESDGGWEYCTPDDEWGQHKCHVIYSLTKEQAFAAVEDDFAMREGIKRDDDDISDGWMLAAPSDRKAAQRKEVQR